jgi:3-hydroxymyristoyl/3-hydroxydecanoyl-(acyl carrier protein) dehydratase
MFSFVDQIAERRGDTVRGRFAIPEQFDGAPDWLMIEAIGQLAAWAAMSDSGFTKRPVAATVGAIDFHGPRRPKGILDLAATIERTDHRAVLYRGEVGCGGGEIASMRRCIGPLLPMEAFDAAENARARYRALTSGDPIALWSPQHRLPRASVSEAEVGPEGVATAEFRIEPDAELFADHFPRQGVVPATMLIETMCRVAAIAWQARLGRVAPAAFEGVRQVKVRKFTEPGQTLQLEARASDGASGEVEVFASSGGETIASVRVICSS